MSNSKKTENKDVENVINKINLYIKKSGITLHQFASNVGYTYQTLYRLLNQHFLPSITSLQTISTYFNCSISELIDNNVFIDIPVYENFHKFLLKAKANDTIRIYLSYEEFVPIFDKDFFAIKNTLNQIECKYLINDLEIVLNTDCCQVFYKTDKISTDGHYFVKYQSEEKILNIVSVARASVVVDFKGDMKHIPVTNIIPIAYYLNTAFYPNYKTQYLNCEPIVGII
jgi:transcriptional regulator with XRE-family HTH domain